MTADAAGFFNTACLARIGAGLVAALGGAGLAGLACWVDLLAGATFCAGRCGLTTAALRIGLAAGTGFFFAAGFAADLTSFFGTAFFGAVDFFGAGFFAEPALFAATFFLGAGADLRFDVAISLSPLSLGGRVL